MRYDQRLAHTTAEGQRVTAHFSRFDGGAVGAGLVCWLYGGTPPDIFLERLGEAIWLPTSEVGMTKASFMASMIGLVACTEGFEVACSTASLGLKTTASVVKSIFLVIALDGLFAMFFAGIGI